MFYSGVIRTVRVQLLIVECTRLIDCYYYLLSSFVGGNLDPFCALDPRLFLDGSDFKCPKVTPMLPYRQPSAACSKIDVVDSTLRKCPRGGEKK